MFEALHSRHFACSAPVLPPGRGPGVVVVAPPRALVLGVRHRQIVVVPAGQGLTKQDSSCGIHCIQPPDVLLHVVPVPAVVRWPVGDHHPLLGTPLGPGHTSCGHQHRGHSYHGPGSHLDPTKALLLLVIGRAVQYMWRRGMKIRLS